MHWNSLQDFLAMGGYAFFVWSSMAVTAAALVVELLSLRGRHARLRNAPSSDSITKSTST